MKGVCTRWRLDLLELAKTGSHNPKPGLPESALNVRESGYNRLALIKPDGLFRDRALLGCGLNLLNEFRNTGDDECSSSLGQQSGSFQGLELSRYHLSPRAHSCCDI